MKTSVTQFLKTSCKTSRSASIDAYLGTMNAAFRGAMIERGRYAISQLREETAVQITHTTVSPGMNEEIISHPGGPSQS